MADPLLDVLAGAHGLRANPARSAVITPSADTLCDTDTVMLLVASNAGRLVTVNRDEVTAQVVFPTEGATACSMRTGVRLEPIGIVGLQVRL